MLSLGLPDSWQPVTIIVLGVMMAVKGLEITTGENTRQEASRKEQPEELSCQEDLCLLETMFKNELKQLSPGKDCCHSSGPTCMTIVQSKCVNISGSTSRNAVTAAVKRY